MRCPHCERENPEENAFCISCGSPLRPESPLGESPGQEAPGEAPPEATSLAELAGEVRGLREVFRELGATLQQYNARIATVERLMGVVPPAPSPARAQPAAATPAQGPGEPLPPPSEAGAEPERPAFDWEQVLGGNWLAIVGGLALVIGVGFFLKLAFDNNWIGETGRVALGVIAGLAFLGAGEYWAQRYGVWAQAVTATGIGILYLSIFAALVLYELIDVYPAFAFLALVTVLSGAASLRYEAPALAVLSVVGGMLTPFMLIGRLDNIYVLAAYVGLLDLGVVGLASFRNWRPLTLLGFLGSLALFGFWYIRVVDGDRPLLGEVVLTGHFLLFVGATTLFHLLWQKRPQAPDLALMTLNAGAYVAISVGLLWDDYEAWLGLFAVGLAAFYAVLASRALVLSGQNAYLTLFLSGIAVVLLTLAIPLQFEGPWVPIAWAAEGAVLTALGVRLASFPLRVSGLVMLAVMVGWLLILEMDVDWRTFQPLLNSRFAGFAVGIGAIYLSAFLLWRGRDQLSYEEEGTLVIPGLLLAANLLTLWILSWEIITYVDSRARDFAFRDLDNIKSFGLSFLWGAYSIILIVIGIARRVRLVRLAALALFWVTIFKVFLLDSFGLTQGYRVASFISLGALLLATGFLYQRYRSLIRGFLLE